MYERFSQDARRAVFFADREARQAGSPYLEPEHLLLGLTHDADSKANQLFALATHADGFRKELEGYTAERSSRSVDVPVSNTCKRVLTCAVDEANQLKSVPIGTEHLLLGLLRENKSKVPAVLAIAGIDLRSARNRIRQELGLPVLNRELETTAEHEQADNKKSRRPLAAFLLLIALLVVIYLIIRLVNK
jgi:ATP-dependent Clp protease ATP-binding subunit ClpC